MIKNLAIVFIFITICGETLCQSNLPVLKSTQDKVSVRDGDMFHKNAWYISPSVRPDVFETEVTNAKNVSFITDLDSISFHVQAGGIYDFIILLNEKDSAYTRIQAIEFKEPAVFSNEYIQEHDGKTFVEIPEVHELMNVIFALTETGRNDRDIVETGSQYYGKVLKEFKQFENDLLVKKIDSLLRMGSYFQLKMDSYAYEFDDNNQIMKSKVYDRLSWGKSNRVAPYVNLLQDFADKTNFRRFYKENEETYDQQIKCYQDTLKIKEMQKWLNKNFPSTQYNSFKIVFSPLVSGNQSANWFENNGFKEAQVHVNFPYPFGNWLRGLSPEAAMVRKGDIVFTELNHAFINPEAEKPIYRSKIDSALNNLDYWIEQGKPSSNYNSAYSCFNEYMNWGMVSLRYLDFAPKNEQELMLGRIEEFMTNGRGFTRFKDFNQFLIKTYRNRNENQSIADIYPKIVGWFMEQSIK
ncbi:MAG TPA: DUF4932 domain-containing protein [Cytophagales bacterium]|nr:DUF4932 domain-containing protein [Cytophagales bacterium]